MRRLTWLSLVPLLCAFGCQRPEVEAFRQHPTPVSVTVTMPGNLQDHDGLQKEYAAALRARLATRMVVVPAGVKPPAGAVDLLVDIRDVSPAPRPADPALVGATAGVMAGIASAASGDRSGAFLNGLFWGLWAGNTAAASRDSQDARLGYRPQVVRAQVRLVQAGNPEPLWVSEVEPRDVVEAMDPLPPGTSQDDVDRIREEEAKGFARVVARRLADDFGWIGVTEQRFYVPAEEKVSPPAKVDPKPPVAAPEPNPKQEAPEPQKDPSR